MATERHSKIHRVRVHGWESGELIVGVLTFDSLEEAVAFAEEKNRLFGFIVKIYNELNELVKEYSHQGSNTYA